MSEKLRSLYEKNYKKILIVPALLLAFSLIYLTVFYIQTGDFIKKDVSLTGGTTVTIFTDSSSSDLHEKLQKDFSDIIINSISDNTGKQVNLVVTTQAEPAIIKSAIESALGYKLTEENSSIEFTGSSLSKDFYKQLITAIILAFFWMACVVFIIYAKGWKIKATTIILNLVLGILLGLVFKINIYLAIIPIVAIAVSLIYIYFKYSIPGFLVMSCAFADMIMTLAIVNLLGMPISAAGIVAFLMLIGYSVDTDILLTTRVLKRGANSTDAVYSSFKTGMTMSLAAIVAVLAALLTVYRFETALNQIFTILLIGLFMDIVNTWITNASLIKWFVDHKRD